MNTQTKQPKGFTIIEVVLVLAIAALIFLMVFIALPALQANQRDQARKQDVGIVVTGVNKYTSAHRTGLAADDDEALREYIDDLDQYDVSEVEVVNTETDPTDRQVLVYPGMACDGPDVTSSGTNSRQVAIRVMLDDGTFYCGGDSIKADD